MIEPLELRKLFAVTLSNGTLTITGTAQDDHVIIYAVPTAIPELTNMNVKVFRTHAGTTQMIQASKKVFRFDLAEVDNLVIESRGGNDRIELNPGAGKVLANIRTGAGSDQFQGGARMVRLHMGDGNDFATHSPYIPTGRFRAFGQGGNDFLKGVNRPDILDGGDGDDWLIGSGDDDTLRGGAGNDTIEGDASTPTASGNDLMFGDDGNDLLMGQRLNDTMDGGAGNDRLVGWSGNDRLYGGDGEDDLNGGPGFDGLYGDAGNDDVFQETSGLYDDSPEDNGDNSLT